MKSDKEQVDAGKYRVNLISELMITFVIGVVCYGIMSGLCIYVLCNIIKWANILYLLVAMAAATSSFCIYSLFRSVKLYKKLKVNT